MKNNISHPTSQIIESLTSLGSIKVFHTGEVVLNEESPITGIPIVKKGNVKVMRTEKDGRNILLYYIKTGESCIMSIFGSINQDINKVKVVAEEETEILFIPINKASMLIKEYPEWTDYVFQLFHKRYEELLEAFNDMAFKKLDQRLIGLLEKKAEQLKNKTIIITHDQLANELGTVRVVVSRILKQMEHEKLVLLGRNKITLV